MNLLLESIVPAVRCFRSRLFRGVSVLVAAGALSVTLIAQTDATPTDPNANGNGNGHSNGNGAPAPHATKKTTEAVAGD